MSLSVTKMGQYTNPLPLPKLFLMKYAVQDNTYKEREIDEQTFYQINFILLIFDLESDFCSFHIEFCNETIFNGSYFLNQVY